jgi:hypothetical protein
MRYRTCYRYECYVSQEGRLTKSSVLQHCSASHYLALLTTTAASDGVAIPAIAAA